ncbi:MAG: 4-alpha-glucanotransferase, partial [Candidatus Heimdallarchaeota archaeon]
SLSDNKINFTNVIKYKTELLSKIFSNFVKSSEKKIRLTFKQFQHENKYWLDDYAIFSSIKHNYNGKPWISWKQGFRDRNTKEILNWLKDYSKEIEKEKFYQFLFYSQLKKLKEYANKKNIKIIGDMPIYVAHDSVDVWANRNLFYLDDKGLLTVVAGVPPDYFSETGQLWGNPIFKWGKMKNNKFDWWIKRFNHLFKYVNILRLDHFRGFESYWEIPANSTSAQNGKWVEGPGEEFFKAIKKKLSSINIIAEDLGEITDKVVELKNKFNFPGMKIFQFGFDDEFNPDNVNLPHNYEKNSVVYAGTHDNQTIKGWYSSLSNKKKADFKKYVGKPQKDIFSNVLKICHQSKSIFAIYPFQDVLRLDDSSIMNRPSTESDNWEWRFSFSQVNDDHLNELRRLTKEFNRDS